MDYISRQLFQIYVKILHNRTTYNNILQTVELQYIKDKDGKLLLQELKTTNDIIILHKVILTLNCIVSF